MYLHDFVNPNSFPDRVRELPRKFLPSPDFSTMKRSEFSKSVPFHATIENVVHMLLQNMLVGYSLNRAGQPINFSLIKNWFGKEGEGLCVEVLGEIPFGEFDDKETSTSGYQLPSHHHRSCFLLYLYWMSSDEVWAKIKKEVVSCRVYDGQKLTEIYVKENNKTKQNKDSFLRNPDMVLGSILSCDASPNGKFNGRLANRLSNPARTLLSSKGGYLQALANLLYACSFSSVGHSNGTVTDLKASPGSVYNCRGAHKVGKFIEMDCKNNPKAFPVKDELLDIVASAVEEYIVFLDVYKQIIYKKKVNGDNVELHEKIVSQTAFFAFFMYDKVIFKKLPSAKTIAERLAYHCNGKGTAATTSLGEKINSLWNFDKDSIDERCQGILEAFRKPAPKEARA